MNKKWNIGFRNILLCMLCFVFLLGSLPAAAFGEESAPAEESASAEASAEEDNEDKDDKSSGEVTDGDDPILTNRLKGWPQAAAKKSDYVCLLDATTDTVLINKSMDVQTPPASLTKIMTTLVALENGDPDELVTMTQTGVDYAVAGSSNQYTVVGETFTLRDMLYGVMLASANDMATQVAEYIGGGSVKKFVKMMNKKAKELGCENTHFVNACGMPADGHLSTAHDMAIISKAAMENEDFREIVGTVNYTIAASQIYAPRDITNHHPSLSDPDNYGWEGVIGGKTGYTDAALNCLATFCERDGRLLICVTMHADTLEDALDDTHRMIQYGFSKWKLRNVKVKDGEKLLKGGKVLTPKKKKLSDLETKVTVKDAKNGKERVKTTYYWSGVEVGSSTVSRDKKEEVKSKAESAESADASKTSKTSESVDASKTSEAVEAVSSPEAGEATAAAEGGQSASLPVEVGIEVASEIPQTAESVVHTATEDKVSQASVAAQQVVLPIGNITMNRASFISIAVLALLILLGLILILLTIALRQ